MAHTYDPQNIFARILRGEIPNKTVLETQHTLCLQSGFARMLHFALSILHPNGSRR